MPLGTRADVRLVGALLQSHAPHRGRSTRMLGSSTCKGLPTNGRSKASVSNERQPSCFALADSAVATVADTKTARQMSIKRS
jgi:hypothetical protein